MKHVRSHGKGAHRMLITGNLAIALMLAVVTVASQQSATEVTGAVSCVSGSPCHSIFTGCGIRVCPKVGAMCIPVLCPMSDSEMSASSATAEFNIKQLSKSTLQINNGSSSSAFKFTITVAETSSTATALSADTCTADEVCMSGGLPGTISCADLVNHPYGYCVTSSSSSTSSASSASAASSASTTCTTGGNSCMFHGMPGTISCTELDEFPYGHCVPIMSSSSSGGNCPAGGGTCIANGYQAGEGQVSGLSCGSGQSVTITSCTYGTNCGGATCDCTAAMNTRCGPNQSCNAVFDNGLCGDPCVGVIKNATLTYTCN